MKILYCLAFAVVLASCSPKPDNSTASATEEATSSADPVTFDALAVDEVMARIYKYAPALGTPSEWLAYDEGGAKCTSTQYEDGQLSLCGYEGHLKSLRYRKMGNGSDEARHHPDGPTGLFLAALETEPYTSTDRQRIIKEVKGRLLENLSVVESLDHPTFVYANSFPIQVEVNGQSYSLSVDPTNEP